MFFFDELSIDKRKQYVCVNDAVLWTNIKE